MSSRHGKPLTPKRCRTRDGEFDAVLSTLGVMFAPHHQTAADELVRVCRPGGTIGLASWTPSGFIGQDVRHHEAVRAHRRLPEHNHRRCGALKITSVSCSVIASSTCAPKSRTDADHPASLLQRNSATTSRPTTGQRLRPIEALADDPDRVEALDRDLAALARRFDQGADSYVVDWEYLLFICRKR